MGRARQASLPGPHEVTRCCSVLALSFPGDLPRPPAAGSRSPDGHGEVRQGAFSPALAGSAIPQTLAQRAEPRPAGQRWADTRRRADPSKGDGTWDATGAEPGCIGGPVHGAWPTGTLGAGGPARVHRAGGLRLLTGRGAASVQGSGGVRRLRAPGGASGRRVPTGPAGVSSPCSPAPWSSPAAGRGAPGCG